MMVQETAQRVSQMAEQSVNILGEDEPCTRALGRGLGGKGAMMSFKTEESSSLPGDNDDDEDDDDDDDDEEEEDDEDEDDDDEIDDGGGSWKNLACLLCNKPNDDPPDLCDLSKDEPYLCASCGQRFELIQNVAAGEPQVSLGLDEDGEDDAKDVKPIVSFEEVDEKLLMPGMSLETEAGSTAGVLQKRSGVCRADSLDCAECGLRFEDAASLERHAMMHMMGSGHEPEPGFEPATGYPNSDRARPFKCDVCARGFNRKDKLKLHLMIHRGEKPLKCEVCGKAFLRRDHLKNHSRTHDRPRTAPKQPIIGAVKQTKKERVVLDAALEEERERPFSCDVCHKAFSRKDNLAAHIRIHTGEKPFSCHLCGKAFAEKCALKRHMVVHTQEKMYPCSICGRAFARKGHLTEHVWLHDEVKPFLCNVCGKAFARDRKLKSHMMTHSGERPFKCDVCDRAFARKDNLKSHLSLHYGVRPNRATRSRSSGGSDSGVSGASDGSGGGPDSGSASTLVPDLGFNMHDLSTPQQLLDHHQLMNQMGIGGGPITMASASVGPVGLGVGMGLVPS